MMIKRGITEANLEKSREKISERMKDMIKCSECGKFYSKKTLKKMAEQVCCPYCNGDIILE